MALASASRSAIRSQCFVSSETSLPSRSLPQRCCANSMFSNRLESDIRIGPASWDGGVFVIHAVAAKSAHLNPKVEAAIGATRVQVPGPGSRRPHATLPAVKRSALFARGAALVLALLTVGATTLLPTRPAVQVSPGRRRPRSRPAVLTRGGSDP